MKTCKKCGETKELNLFYKHPQASDGYDSKCKECAKSAVKANRLSREEYYKAYDRQRGKLDHRLDAVKERQKKNSKSHSEANARYAAKNKERRAAQHAISNAIRYGKVEKLPCFICGSLNVEGHHPDYSTPLDVVWLCVPHHKEIHRKHDHDKDVELLETAIKGNRWDSVKGNYDR